MRVGVLGAVVLLAGCDQIFGVPAPATDARTVDAAARDSSDEQDAAIDAPPDAPPDAPVACPSSYPFGRNASRYRYASTAASWTAAAADCADDLASPTLHTHLVVMGSDQERSFVQALEAFTDPWVGLSDRRGTMQWVTAENVPVPLASDPAWATGEPSGGAGEDCVFMKTADYSDDLCAAVRTYFCECDAFANDPMRY